MVATLSTTSPTALPPAPSSSPLLTDSVSNAIAAGQRLSSVDTLRGIVIVLMAIDHVRGYAGLPAGGPTAGIFFTRWVTHCRARVFVFLTGTGALFYGRKHGTSGLVRYLVTRGVVVILYFACAWYGRIEAARPDSLRKYI